MNTFKGKSPYWFPVVKISKLLLRVFAARM